MKSLQWKFSPEAWSRNNTRLTNQIFKLLPMKENGEDWKKQANSLILEFHGYNKMFENNPAFMVMIAKLSALEYVEEILPFRKLIFEALTELKNISL